MKVRYYFVRRINESIVIKNPPRPHQPETKGKQTNNTQNTQKRNKQISKHCKNPHPSRGKSPSYQTKQTESPSLDTATSYTPHLPGQIMIIPPPPQHLRRLLCSLDSTLYQIQHCKQRSLPPDPAPLINRCPKEGISQDGTKGE